jgi:cytochrome c-type biogenesis protein CcmF
MLGVVYPLIYEYLFDQKISVGAPFYNAIFIPIVILASLFLFFSIDSKWSRNIGLKIFTKPIGLSLLLSVSVTTIIFFYFEVSKIFILLSVFTGLLVIFRYLIEIWFSLFYKKYLNPFSAIAHLALGLLLVSISLNSLLSTERALNIKINEFENYKDLKIYFNDLRVNKGSNYDAIMAEFYIEDKNGNGFNLSPEKRRYFTRGQITTETAIHVTPIKDVYLTIGDQLDDGSWTVNIQINFLIRWIWFSAFLMAFAGIILISSRRRT